MSTGRHVRSRRITWVRYWQATATLAILPLFTSLAPSAALAATARPVPLPQRSTTTQHQIVKRPVRRLLARFYVVRPGDNLTVIARHVYGSAKDVAALWWINRRAVPHPDQIRAGQRLRLSAWHPDPPAWLSKRLQAALAAEAPAPAATAAVASPGGSAPQAPQPVQASGSLQAYAQALLNAMGWGGQFSCLDAVINVESGWNVYASNASGAYGIPQALPGSKMAAAGADWATNGDTQLRWMIDDYIGMYGGPCGAWGHEQQFGWY